MVVVAHDQLLGAIQPSSDVNLGSAEGEVAKVPYGIALPDNAVPSLNQFFVVFLDGCEWAKETHGIERDDSCGRSVCRR
jgi:hypothetical protein